MKKIIIIILCFQFGSILAQEQDKLEAIAEANQLVAIGNEILIKESNFPKAEGEYRKAIDKNPVDVTAKYNLANAYYNTEKYDEAIQRYAEAVKIADAKTERHKAFHNQGNTYMEQKKYKEAVEAYKNALRNDSKDNKTRYNLALAKKMLEEEQKNDQNKDDKDKDDQDKDDQENKDQEGENKDKKDSKDGKEDDKKDKKEDEGDDKEDKKEDEGGNKDDKKEGDKKDDEGGNKDDKKEGDKKEDENGKPKDDKKEPQQVEGKLSPQQVKSLLEAMNNQEKKVQDKVNANKVQGAKVKTEKDW